MRTEDLLSAGEDHAGHCRRSTSIRHCYVLAPEVDTNNLHADVESRGRIVGPGHDLALWDVDPPAGTPFTRVTIRSR